MSTTSSSATTTLYVNGKPAEDEIRRLRGELDQYKKQLLDIAADPSKGLGSKEWSNTLAKIKATEKELGNVRSNVANVTQALGRLDKATPKELRMALRQLKQELANIERGSKAWNEHMKKIRSVQTEINKLNNEMKGHQSLWTRFADKMFAWGAALQTVMAGFTGVTFAAREAVKAYAEMDQEMANVRKFTGMTSEQVENLNEEFKRMDTRTSREGLNLLAQEAGRLGKSSKEDVLGFVRAADQINVALDDLGEGATLTLSKLTGIFGDEQRYGTEQALLKVGSVINELSQNCSASAPYIAEFASRLGGVGSQAKMSVQQIMAYGAVLDSAQQNVESSSTALSQLIVKLYRDPANYAAAAGLDVQKFTELLKKDANEAVLTLLETLNKAGGMDALAPMFADMGEKGARSVQTLSVLAGKIDEVRAQQVEANKAFAEGTSVTKEFDVQNNTVQAGLEKAKKSFNEMAVELGAKLAPAMKYAITGSAAMMRALSLTITFISEHSRALVNTAIALAGFTIAVKASAIATAAHSAASKAAALATAGWNAIVRLGTSIQKGYTYVLGLAKVAQIAFTNGTVAARIAFTALNATIKTNPFGLLITAVTTAALAIYNFKKKSEDARAEQERLRKTSLQSAEAIRQAEARIGEETSAVKRLTDAINAENVGSNRRNVLIKQFNDKFGGYLSNLLTEKSTARDVAAAYAQVVKQLRAKLLLEAKEKDYQQTVGVRYGWEAQKLSDFDKVAQSNGFAGGGAWLKAAADEAWTSGARSWNEVQSYVFRAYAKQAQKQFGKLPGEQGFDDADLQETMTAYTRQYVSTRVHQQQVDRKWQPYQDDIDNLVEESYADGVGVPVVGASGASAGDDKKGGGSKKTEDRFKTEKAWREKEIALAKIAWLKGETDYEQHTDRMEQIEVEYYDKILARADLSEQERLEAQGKSLEAQKKQKETAHDRTIEQENQQYAELQAVVQNDYLQGRISRQAYDMQMENIEFAHLRAMTQLTKEGTDERAKAEAAYRQKLVAEQQKRQKESADKEKQHQEELKKIKEDYFGPNAAENKALYDAALKNLQKVYDAELRAAGDNAKEKLRIEKAFLAAKAALRKQFNQDDQTENQNFLKAWGQSVNDWLQSDMGKAVTGTLETVTNSMSSLFQQMSSLIQAEADIEVAAIERRYDTEISRAEGNQNKVKALERRKERETAKIKNEAARRQMSMQVIQAIAQTATAALNAYSSAAAIPVVGYILAPIAASMAVAAGMMQVAAIKKQQQAQEAQGYATGGFTPDGPADKPVGIVHAGEWVASQKLLRNPATRPAIEALDYAQRHNTMGSIRAADVSRSVAASQVVARTTADDTAMTAMAAAMARYADTMRDLGDRLNEPFVTVNTIEGDTGIKQAQDEYQRLMNNTLPKNRRK